MTETENPSRETLRLIRIEEIFEDHEIFSLEDQWKTENKVAESHLPEDKRSTTYRHITSGNTTYGLVSRSGEVRLHVRFVDQSAKPREEIIPEILGNYAYLATHLKASGIEYTPDERFEKAIDDATESLVCLRNVKP